MAEALGVACILFGIWNWWCVLTEERRRIKRFETETVTERIARHRIEAARRNAERTLW